MSASRNVYRDGGIHTGPHCSASLA